MARVTIDGIDQLMAGLNQRGSALRPIIEEALTESATVVHERMLDEEASSFKDPSGELGEFITDGGVWHGMSSSMITVYFKGDDYKGRRGKPRRSGLVAAMVEHKHKNPWVRRSMTKSKKRVNSIIGEALSGKASIYSERGGL